MSVLLALLHGAAAAPPLSLHPSPDGADFAIRAGPGGVDWLASAGPQLGGAALPRVDAGAARRHSGTDAIGAYDASSLDYRLPRSGGVLTATTKVYRSSTLAAGAGDGDDSALVVVFEQRFGSAVSEGLAQGAPTSPAQRQVSAAFPTFKPPATPTASGAADAALLPAAANCTLAPATDFNGGDIQRLSAATPEACCALCSQTPACKVFTSAAPPHPTTPHHPTPLHTRLTIAARLRRWYTSERHGSTGKGTEYHCNLKSGIVKRMTNQPNHTSGVCNSHIAPPARGPPLNAWTLWGPSGMFNELTRLWSPGALSNDGKCGSAGNDKGCDGMGPLVIYDRNLTTLLIAPLDQFMVNSAAADASTIRCGLRGSVASVPAGFTLSTILVGGRGVTATVRRWGELMLRRYGKPPAQQRLRAAYERDPSLRSLSYWTDAVRAPRSPRVQSSRVESGVWTRLGVTC